MRIRVIPFTLLGLLCLANAQAQLVLENAHIQAAFGPQGRLVRLSRTDGSDALDVQSDVFEVLLLDDSRFTADDYQAAVPERTGQTLQIHYTRKAATDARAPASVTVTYELGTGPALHKSIVLKTTPRAVVDRLQVLRLSTPVRASHGGFGQPVFLGNWFLGMDYPGFYSRHSYGFAEPQFYYRIPYNIELDGRDREIAPRKGLVTVFHFPGYASDDGIVQSKRAVIGISATKGDGAELGLLDYIARTRKPPRSHLHYNNWYSPEGKDLSLDNILPNVHKPIREELAKYGAVLNSIVPDHGWQNGKSYDRIYEPKPGLSLPALSKALRADGGTRLGIWIALDGTNQSTARGLQVGYRLAIPKGARTTAAWMERKPWLDILDPRYQSDLREALRHLIQDAKIDYIKHDFNHNFSSGHISQRHAREACLDVTLGLLAYERSLNPDIYQNYTNGTWFSPWWLQHADSLWMMSGDSGNSREWPQLSFRDRSTSYRDKYFFESFNNPDRCPRPVIPIANFMTHGIIFTTKKPFTDFKDLPDAWANHVMMYFARGTLVKELYLTPKLLSEGHWRALGTTAAWAVRNQARLVNTVPVGGDPAAGQAHGTVSWVGGRAILTVRNPDRREQTLTVPFDRTVYHRGEFGLAYHARAIYPFVEQMPWALRSGQTIAIRVQGDSVRVYEIEPGAPASDRELAPGPLPEFEADVQKDGFTLALLLPDEDMPRCDLLVQPWGAVGASLTVNGEALQPRQHATDARWALLAYDLRPYRGKTLAIKGVLTADKASKPVPTEVWLLADRPVAAGPAPRDEVLPFPISQAHRRQTRNLIPRTPLAAHAPN